MNFPYRDRITQTVMCRAICMGLRRALRSTPTDEILGTLAACRERTND
jgi:hypothetical protein